MNRFRQSLNSIFGMRGFSTVELMIGSSVLIGVGLAGSVLFKNQKVATVQIEEERKLNATHSELSKVLHDVGNCNATFKAFAGTGSISGSIANVQFCSSNCSGEYEASATSGYSVLSVGGNPVTNDKTWSVASMTFVSAVTTSGRGTLRIGYTNSVQNKTIYKDIELSFRFGTTGFLSCNGERQETVSSLASEICQALAPATTTGQLAVWNDDTQFCNLQSGSLKSCTGAASNIMVAGITSTGSYHCQAITSGLNPSTIMSGATATCPASTGTVARLGVNGSGQVTVSCF